jgi:predicted RNase H-like HicB family nuclease
MPRKLRQLIADLERAGFANRGGKGSHRNYILKLVEWSAADGCFVGSAPPLIGPCCHGTDEVKVYTELCQIVEEWIALLKNDGVALPDAIDGKKYAGKFMVRVEPAIHRRLAAKAQLEGESLNQYVAKALIKA